MQFAFADPLRLPTRRIQALFLDRFRLSRASHLAAGRVSDTPVTEGSSRPGRRFDSGVIGFVSYVSFVSSETSCLEGR